MKTHPPLVPLCLCSPILQRRASHAFLKDTAEMLGVLESKFVCYLTDGQISVCDPVFGNIDYLVLNIFLSGHAGFFLYKVSEIIR